MFYMFQAVFPSTIRRSKLHIQRQVLVCKYLTLYVKFWSPDGGRKNRLKHVEHLTEINKLSNVAFYCLYSANKFSSISFISIQPWRPGLAGTRAQSCDRYGSGTLHPGQVLGGSLPLLSYAAVKYTGAEVNKLQWSLSWIKVCWKFKTRGMSRVSVGQY